MKTTIFYTVTFLAFLLASSSMAISKFILSVNCCSIDSVARFLNRKVRSQVILDQLKFRKTPLTGSNTNGDCEENPQHYYYFWNRVPRLYFWANCKFSRGPSFSIASCTSATSYKCGTTITFLIAQQWTTSDATTINISFSAINCTQPPVQLIGLLVIWMQHGDLQIFIMTHQHAEVRNHFP